MRISSVAVTVILVLCGACDNPPPECTDELPGSLVFLFEDVGGEWDSVSGDVVFSATVSEAGSPVGSPCPAQSYEQQLALEAASGTYMACTNRVPANALDALVGQDFEVRYDANPYGEHNFAFSLRLVPTSAEDHLLVARTLTSSVPDWVLMLGDISFSLDGQVTSICSDGCSIQQERTLLISNGVELTGGESDVVGLGGRDHTVVNVYNIFRTNEPEGCADANPGKSFGLLVYPAT